MTSGCSKTGKISTKISPSYREENYLINQGYSIIAGLDEVGRGTLAGPVVAGLVILQPRPTQSWLNEIRDSKLMTPRQRSIAAAHLNSESLASKTGVATSTEIDNLGIVRATQLAMERALDSCDVPPQFILVDALPLPQIDIPHKAIIRGDLHCLSIASASIIAKVARDEMMVNIAQSYPGYGFEKHKGYGTKKHMDALNKLGPCSIHRHSFSPIKNMDVLK